MIFFNCCKTDYCNVQHTFPFCFQVRGNFGIFSTTYWTALIVSIGATHDKRLQDFISPVAFNFIWPRSQNCGKRLFALSCLSVRVSAWNNSAPTVRIFMKFDTWVFFRKTVESHKKRTGDLWNTRRETQIQTKLDQPPWKNGQHQTPETRPQLQTSRKKRPWTPPRNDGNASMPKHVKRPNPWRKMMMMIMMTVERTEVSLTLIVLMWRIR